MAYQLNEKVRDMVPYEPISGSYRIRLDANESFLEIPEHVKADMLGRIGALHLNRYPDPLAREVCEGFGRYYGVKPELVTVGNGSDELLTLLTQAIMMKGEKLVYTAPDFSMYQCYGYLAENECIPFAKNDDFTIDVDALASLIQAEQARMVIFSNPCNPTGVGLPRVEVLRLIESVPDCLVVVDEAYMEFWNQSVLDCVEQYDNLMVLKTCSKSLRMAGIRCGFAIANPTLTNAMRAVKSPYNVNSMTQTAAATLFDYPHELDSATAAVIESRDTLYASVKALMQKYPDKLSLLPTSANFVYVKLPSGEAKRIFEAMKQEGVIVRHMGDYLRITCGTAHENIEVVRLLEENL
ncbi:MAG: histidinol-phosphate aminotransferase family protein [Clostridia bacterium]|nr:histidinol-phosphate aminotransferase family protein [Clostridia bacterium]